MSDHGVSCWMMRSVGEPLVCERRPFDVLAPTDVRVRVAGCGVCHTDLGYLYDGVRTRHELPLTLGHEIAGIVEAVGEQAPAELVGREVIVPAVIPCGDCDRCRAGRGSICSRQVFPGCDVHGGFASHVVVPARGLCEIDEEELAGSGLKLSELSVLADAISTPYQSIVRSDLGEGDVAVFVGAGGVGGFGVQIAAALGAHAIALDVSSDRLEALRDHGARGRIDVSGMDPRAVRRAVRDYAKAEKLPDACWRIFETSGTAAGQATAFGLLNHGAYLGIVGYTMDAVEVRLSNLMAFDAVAEGNWGCLPELYPEALDLVLSGDVAVRPFVERRPMSDINQTFEDVRHHRISRRPVLVPDFD